MPSDAGAVAASPESAPVVTPLPPAPGDRTPAEIFRDWAPSVVTIRRAHGGIGDGAGTGFVISEDGMVATNHHVVEDARTLAVKLYDGSWATRVELLTFDEHADVALLRIEASSPLVPVILGDSEAVTVGERAISIGNPLGLEHTLTDGLVSARRVVKGRPMIQMTTPISPGNSGGPLFNLRGEVIGVSTASLVSFGGTSQNLNLAVPVNVLKKLVRDDGDYPDRRDVTGDAPMETDRW